MRRIASTVLLFIPATLSAWGNAGHQITARLAEAQLSPAVRSAARALIANKHLSDVCVDPDGWKKRPGDIRTGEWHFVDIPKEPPATAYDPARDCRFSDCAVDRIELFRAVLADRTASQKARADALTYLIHFVGDLHQPFHCVTGPMPGGGTDHGANLIHVTINGQHLNGTDNTNDNLHFVWDVTLVDDAIDGKTQSQFVTALLTQTLAGRNPQQLAGGTTVDWANASHQLAVGAYVPDHTDLHNAYVTTNVPIVREQLLLGGLRLGRLIEEALR